jgi:hypothetical protein
MFPLVAFPRVVDHYAPYFAPVFSPEALIQFQRYISGLLVSENKTIDGINQLFVREPRHQSSLNRFLTAASFTVADLNQARLRLLQTLPGTAFKPKGVLSLDDTLLTHYGQHFEQIACLYDHTQQRYVWAHNLVTLHYSDDATDYPVAFALWQPADLAALEQGLRAAGIALKASKCLLKDSAPPKWRQYLLGVWRRHQDQPAVAALYDSKLVLARRLVQQWVADQPTQHLPVTFDSWYTQPAFCRDLDELGLAYVGTLAEDAQIVLQSGPFPVAEFAARLKGEQLATDLAPAELRFRPITIPFKGQRERYYSYCQTHHVKNFGRVRLVINHRQADLSDSPVYYISNRLVWQAEGITRIRRHRWPVEVYHEEGKAEGLDQYQLRDFAAIERHVACVAVVYSLLRATQADKILQQALQRELKMELEGSMPFWRRVTQAESLWNIGLMISAGLAQGQELGTVLAPLLRAVCSH